MGDSVDDKKAQRFRFLNALYGKTDGDEHAQVQMFDLGKELGLSTNVTERAVQYLVGEDLMEHAAMGGYVAITHYGVVQVEEALDAPSQSTQYFPPVINILNVEQMTGSHVQQAGEGARFSVSIATTDLAELRSLVADLHRVAKELEKQTEVTGELSPQLATLDAQLESPRPNVTIVREALAACGERAERDRHD